MYVHLAANRHRSLAERFLAKLSETRRSFLIGQLRSLFCRTRSA